MAMNWRERLLHSEPRRGGGRAMVATKEDTGVEAMAAEEEEISVERHRWQWMRPA
jgi:hypothetical protein